MRLTTILAAVLLFGTMAVGDEIRVAAAADLVRAVASGLPGTASALRAVASGLPGRASGRTGRSGARLRAVAYRLPGRSGGASVPASADDVTLAKPEEGSR